MRIHALVVIVSVMAAGAALAQGRERPGGMFDGADGNGDGVITRGEFLNARADQFSTRDRNSDGFIDKEDLSDRAARRQRMTQAVTAMVTQLDADNDGKVNKGEFVDGGAKLFDRADTDKSDSLDSKEIEAAKGALRERAGR
jgi:Ca2+-binding EF-hand superfamily protein